MEILFGIALALAMYFYISYSPAMMGVRNLSGTDVYMMIDGMTLLIEPYKVKVFIKTYKKPKEKKIVNCNVRKEYLGPTKRGHFRL